MDTKIFLQTLLCKVSALRVQTNTLYTKKYSLFGVNGFDATFAAEYNHLASRAEFQFDFSMGKISSLISTEGRKTINKRGGEDRTKSHNNNINNNNKPKWK